MKLKYKFFISIIATSAVILTSLYINSDKIHKSIVGIKPVFAQRAASSNAWRQVYQKLPDFPLENKYVSKRTGKIAESQTLALRLIRYHIFLKGRAPNTRLDWKLTLADYLGANEIMYDSSYPASDTLKKNPINGDRTAIKRLNRSQRNTLIQVLVNIFNQK
ncbi:MAG: hypothetical protein MJK14_06085 [Rivularia sp. ALOHA_DT_140]|nr:hypothetical protein [Rivularia sp. ALOHA_DT_140]